jgi:hypothetical protein
MADIPNLNPTPKQDFLKSDLKVKQHMALIERDDLDTSLNAALLQYQLMLCSGSKDANEAAARHFKMAGALEFLNVFKYLGLREVQSESKIIGQLNHKA